MRDRRAAARVGVQRLGQAEVQHLDRALAGDWTFCGFRSRWTMPRSCAASSASAICSAIGSASSSGIASGGDAVREAPTVDELEHQDRRVSAGPAMSSMPWIAAMFGWLSAASTRASRSNRDRRSGSCDQRRRQDLQRDVALQPHVARAIDLAHPAGAEQPLDLVSRHLGAGRP